jgi:hypothetical protein
MGFGFLKVVCGYVVSWKGGRWKDVWKDVWEGVWKGAWEGVWKNLRGKITVIAQATSVI